VWLLAKLATGAQHITAFAFSYEDINPGFPQHALEL